MNSTFCDYIWERKLVKLSSLTINCAKTNKLSTTLLVGDGDGWGTVGFVSCMVHIIYDLMTACDI